jgi:hypothetical protein
MSYDIFFVRRDPGQSFEDALDSVEESYDGGDPGPLSEEEIELWEALLPQAREVLGPEVEITQDDDETRELTDPATGVGLTFFQGEFEIHVPTDAAAGRDPQLLDTVYELARTVEVATGLEGYDPQLGVPISDTSETSPTRRTWVGDDAPDDAAPDDEAPDVVDLGSGLTVGAQGGADPARPPGRRRWGFRRQ